VDVGGGVVCGDGLELMGSDGWIGCGGGVGPWLSVGVRGVMGVGGAGDRCAAVWCGG